MCLKDVVEAYSSNAILFCAVGRTFLTTPLHFSNGADTWVCVICSYSTYSCLKLTFFGILCWCPDNITDVKAVFIYICPCS